MADNNNFWEDKDDDFWSKPVVSDDWLNEKKEAPKWDDPFADLRKDEPEYGIPNQPVYTQKAAAPAQKKNYHVHTIICLIFIGIAVLSVIGSVLASKAWRSKAVQINETLDYEEIAVTESFPMYTNNMVTLEEQAYTITEQANDMLLLGALEGEKLIAVYARVESDEYVSAQYALALRNIFIGYEIDGQRQFRRCLQVDTALIAVAKLGFSQDDMLNTYGVGNGSNDYGFFLFCVPSEVDEITFYAEEREGKREVSVVTRRYEKAMEVWDISDVDISELISEKRENSR